jgi:hypothetical protein
MPARTLNPNRRRFEALENRSMLAGNVTAAVTGGNLTITGDDSANIISLTQVASGGWKITGSATKVNGSTKAFTTDPVTGNINITLNGGNDTLVMTKGNIPGHLTILGNDGADVTTLSSLTIGTFLHFEGNNGNDTLAVTNVQVSDPTFLFFSSIDMQDGNDTVVLNHFIDQDLEVTLGTGNDALSIANSSYLGGPFQRLIINAGDGTDVVSLANVQTGPLSVDMGPGKKDTLTLAKVTADTGTFLDTNGTNGIISGSGDHIGTQTIDPNFTVRGGDLRNNT